MLFPAGFVEVQKRVRCFDLGSTRSCLLDKAEMALSAFGLRTVSHV
jgi:hypothetical protein